MDLEASVCPSKRSSYACCPFVTGVRTVSWKSVPEQVRVKSQRGWIAKRVALPMSHAITSLKMFLAVSVSVKVSCTVALAGSVSNDEADGEKEARFKKWGRKKRLDRHLFD